MDAGMIEMRELLIELRLKIQHLSTSIDQSLSQTNAEHARLRQAFDDYVRLTNDRIYSLERNLWIAIGAVSIISYALPYIARLIGER